MVAYLGAGLAALGALPTRDRIVIERVLRRERGHPAHRARPLRRPHQPGPRPGPAQAVLRLVRLRAAGGGRRRHRGALPRPPAQLPADPVSSRCCPARTAAEVLTQAVLPHPDAGGPLAVEPQPGPGRAALPRRQAPARSTSSGWRPTTSWPRRGRRWPPARRTPRPVRSSVPDHVLVRQTVDDCLTEPLDAAGLVTWSRIESGRVAVHLVESSEPSPVRPRHPDRPALHLPRRRSARGATHPGRARCSGAWARSGPTGLPVAGATELGRSTRTRSAEVLEQVRPATAQRRRAARPAPLAGAVPTGGRVAALVRRALEADGRASAGRGAWVPTERLAWPSGARRCPTR